MSSVLRERYMLNDCAMRFATVLKTVFCVSVKFPTTTTAAETPWGAVRGKDGAIVQGNLGPSVRYERIAAAS